MRNPFKFGSVVTGQDFADRQRELAELGRELSDGQHLFLLSPRRFGKTSLVLALLERLRSRGLLTAYVDVFRATSAPQLLELLAQAVLAAAETRPERLLRLALDLLGRLRPQVGTDAAGRPTLTLDIGSSRRAPLALQEEVLALPQRLAASRGRRLVVAFDEFQEIQRFPGAALERAMRSHFQGQDRVSYLFSGSKESLLRDMATRERSPFYKFGRTVSLGPIPPAEFLPFLAARFRRAGLRPGPGTLEAVIATADDVPYNVQRLCHQLWAMRAAPGRGASPERLTEEDVAAALAAVVEQDSPHFGAAWDRLSLHQRRVLQAIAQSGGTRMFAAEFLAAHRLGSHSSLQTSLRQLTKEQIVIRQDGEYRIADPFFREWIAARLP